MSNPPPTPIETVTKETSRRISRLNAIYSTALELRNPQGYIERTAELKASVARAEADVAGIKRELSRLNK